MEKQLLPEACLRGSDDHPNFILIQGQFYKVHPELVSFNFLYFREGGIRFIGYSKHLKAVCVRFSNGHMFIDKDIAEDVWEARNEYKSIVDFYFEKVRNSQCKDVDYEILMVTNETVMEHILNIEYQWTITRGLWATEAPEKVHDPEKTLFQI